MTNSKIKCNHKWHLVENLDGVSVKLGKVFYYFVCDKCGNLKKIERGELI